LEHFEVSETVSLPIETVWEAHEDVHLLERISPPFPVVRVLDSNIICGLGTRFTIRVELFEQIGIDWQVQITRWEPPRRFIDKQLRGPFQFWEHIHQFIPISDRETRLVDVINFELNPFLDSTAIRWGLETMFQMRMNNLKQTLLNENFWTNLKNSDER
jgi:ligand-binding SRPBCC domain-containing protein